MSDRTGYSFVIHLSAGEWIIRSIPDDFWAKADTRQQCIDLARIWVQRRNTGDEIDCTDEVLNNLGR